MSNTIFVQIASYRDPDLYNTLSDMYSKAKYPDNLFVCICWQNSKKDDWENIHKLMSFGKNIKIIDVNYEESKGVCWARNKVQQEYGGEKYTLQIDSHHRFIEHWDEELIDMIENIRSKGYDKPLLTAYAPSFSPDNDPEDRVQTPWKMAFDRFIPEGAVFFAPSVFDINDNDEAPIPSRFYSAHFAFADGSFCVEVQHDPELYFHGEEITIAVRAFTFGYDIFHPHKIILWHEYTRMNRAKHWDDNKKWHEMNNRSHLRGKKLLGVDGIKSDINFGKYGLGKKRSLMDYQKYAGICFQNRSITNDVIKKISPNLKNMKQDDEYFNNSLTRIFKHCIDLNRQNLKKVDDYDFWCVAFKNDNDEDLYRKDADKKEIDILMNNTDFYIKLWREFPASEQPKSWIVWPHSVSQGWLDPITGILK